MPEITQKTIEYFFEKHGVTNPDKKAKILPLVTDVIYDYNMIIVDLEKESDDYKKKQLTIELKELDDKLDEIFCDELNICSSDQKEEK